MKRVWLLSGAFLALSACSSSDLGDRAGVQRAAIAGGTPDTSDSDVVAIFREYSPIIVSSVCTGTLIAPNVVITARHCIEDYSGIGCAAQFSGQVYPYVWVTTAPDSSASSVKLYKAAKVLRPNTNPTLCSNDLALIVLEQSIPSAEATPRAPRIASALAGGNPVSAVGYGGIDQNQTGKGIRRRYDGAGVACVGPNCSFSDGAAEWLGNAPLCPGDSGGPAIDADGRVAGVASRGDCSTSVYTRPECFAAFLVASVNDAATQGGYSAPSWTSETLGTLDPSCSPSSSGSGGTSGSGGASSGGTGAGGTGAGGTGSGGVGGGESGGAGGVVGGAGGTSSATGGSGWGAAGAQAGGAADSKPAADSSSDSGCAMAHHRERFDLALFLAVVAVLLRRRTTASAGQ
jgi:hypothetical protein